MREALSITDHSYIMSAGNIITSGTTEKLLDDPLARKSYFGEKFLGSDIRAKNSFSTYENKVKQEGSQWENLNKS